MVNDAVSEWRRADLAALRFADVERAVAARPVAAIEQAALQPQQVAFQIALEQCHVRPPPFAAPRPLPRRVQVGEAGDLRKQVVVAFRHASLPENDRDSALRAAGEGYALPQTPSLPLPH